MRFTLALGLTPTADIRNMAAGGAGPGAAGRWGTGRGSIEDASQVPVDFMKTASPGGIRRPGATTSTTTGETAGSRRPWVTISTNYRNLRAG